MDDGSLSHLLRQLTCPTRLDIIAENFSIRTLVLPPIIASKYGDLTGTPMSLSTVESMKLKTSFITIGLKSGTNIVVPVTQKDFEKIRNFLISVSEKRSDISVDIPENSTTEI